MILAIAKGLAKAIRHIRDVQVFSFLYAARKFESPMAI